MQLGRPSGALTGPSRWPPPTPAAGHSDCQQQCLLDGNCVAWMWGTDADPVCQVNAVTGEVPAWDPTTGQGCPDKVCCAGSTAAVCRHACSSSRVGVGQCGAGTHLQGGPTAAEQAQRILTAPDCLVLFPPSLHQPMNPWSRPNGRGCKRGYCYRLSGYYRLVEYNMEDGNPYPGAPGL